MEERRDQKPFAHVLYRGMYDQAARNGGEYAVGAAADVGRIAEEPPGAGPVAAGAAQSADGARDGEPFLAGGVRHGPRADGRRFRRAGRAAVHPELLDWLAVEFRESGWDVKKFFELLVTSAAYRQAARATPEKLEKDPENRLLSRGPRFRMDAEMVRDYALAASGLLAARSAGRA